MATSPRPVARPSEAWLARSVISAMYTPFHPIEHAPISTTTTQSDGPANPAAIAISATTLPPATTTRVVACEAKNRSDTQPHVILARHAAANATLRANPAVVFENPCVSTRYTVR